MLFRLVSTALTGRPMKCAIQVFVPSRCFRLSLVFHVSRMHVPGHHAGARPQESFVCNYLPLAAGAAPFSCRPCRCFSSTGIDRTRRMMQENDQFDFTKIRTHAHNVRRYNFSLLYHSAASMCQHTQIICSISVKKYSDTGSE